MNKARPVAEVLKDEKTPIGVKKALDDVSKIRLYGEKNGLKPTKNYSDYVKLNRPYVVWSVSACESLRFVPKSWNFPFVGSFTYLGWFDEEDANKFATSLRDAGWDVDVRGVTAYSTLGWFRDPVTSSMITGSEDSYGYFANIILHETVHATVYIKDQSWFNESLASFAADRMTTDYLRERFGSDSREYGSHLGLEKKRNEWQKKFRMIYEEMSRIYKDTSKTDAEKLEDKTNIFARLKEQTGIKREINNATLIQYRTYGSGMDEFESLFKACKMDWRSFFNTISTMDPREFKSAQQEDFGPVVLELVKRGCRYSM